MTENLHPQLNQFEQTNQTVSQLKPQTKSKFNQFKSWLNKTQTENMNQNIEVAVTGQTPLKRTLAKVEGLITGNNTKTETLAQDLIDYRYEMARLERKRIREAKGQTFEEYVNEIVGQKSLEKLKGETTEPTKSKPKVEKPKTANSISDRIKAVAALAMLSGSMMTAPALANNKSKVESKIPTKTEQTKENKVHTQTKNASTEKTISGYTNSKFKFSIPNIEASKVKTGTVVNEYHSNGIKFKGRFVMMPNGALFNLQGRTIKQTPKNIYAIENDRSGYFNLNDLKAKKVTTGQKISILNGEIVTVPDSTKSVKNTERKKLVTTKPNSELPNKPANSNLKPKPTTIGQNKSDTNIKPEFPKVAYKQEKLPTSITANYLDPSTGSYKQITVTEPNFVKQVASHRYEDWGEFFRCNETIPEIWKTCTREVYTLNGQKYVAKYYKINGTSDKSGVVWKQEDKWRSGKVPAEIVNLIPFDPNKPNNIVNFDPYYQAQFPGLIKVKYWGSDVYFRPIYSDTMDDVNNGREVSAFGMLAKENDNMDNLDSFRPNGSIYTRYTKYVTIKKGWNGDLEIHNVRDEL